MKKSSHNKGNVFQADFGGGGEPPVDINARLTAIEATLPHLATKEDVANLRVSVAEVKTSMVQWIIGLGVGLGSILIPILGKVMGWW